MIVPSLLLALTVIAGNWHAQGGALDADAGGEQGKRVAAAALVGPDASPDRIEAVATGLASGAGGVNAFIIFDVERDEAGRIARAHFAGLYVGARRAAIGEIGKRGRPRILAEASCDVRAGESYHLRVTIDGSNATLAVEGADIVTCDLGERRGSGQGFLTYGRA
ncbi:MAG: hypothetical protein ACRELB_24455, partial [Polyangiaceae bacterium]